MAESTGARILAFEILFVKFPGKSGFNLDFFVSVCWYCRSEMSHPSCIHRVYECPSFRKQKRSVQESFGVFVLTLYKVTAASVFSLVFQSRSFISFLTIPKYHLVYTFVDFLQISSGVDEDGFESGVSTFNPVCWATAKMSQLVGVHTSPFLHQVLQFLHVLLFSVFRHHQPIKRQK